MLLTYVDNIIRHEILSKVPLIVSRRFCYAESSSQIGLSRQDFEKIAVKCAKKDNFGHIYYAIMTKITVFLNYNDAILKCYFLC